MNWRCLLVLCVLFSAPASADVAELRRPGNSWADVVVLPSGYGMVSSSDTAVTAETPASVLWSVALPEPVLYLQGAACGAEVRAVGQGNFTGQAYEIKQSGVRAFAPSSFGQNATQAACEGGRFIAYVQVATDAYARVDLDSMASQLVGMPGTSQGFRDTVGGEVRLGDAWMQRIIRGRSIHQPVERGGFWAGQWSTGTVGIGVILPDRAFTAVRGLAFEPALERIGDTFAIAVRTPDGATLAIITPPYPPDEPIVTPPEVCGNNIDDDGDGLVDENCEPEPQACGEIPSAGQTALRQLAARPDINRLVRSADDEERRTSARMFAQQLAFTVDPAWGTKNAGDGRPQSRDSVSRMVGSNLCNWDIVDGTTRALKFGHGEFIPGQVFVAVTPTNHLGGTIPDPDPDPDPALVARVAALEGALSALNAQLSTIRATALDLGARVVTLEQKPDPGGVQEERARALILDYFARASVTGKTGSGFYIRHDHPVNLGITIR